MQLIACIISSPHQLYQVMLVLCFTTTKHLLCLWQHLRTTGKFHSKSGFKGFWTVFSCPGGRLPLLPLRGTCWTAYSFKFKTVNPSQWRLNYFLPSQAYYSDITWEYKSEKREIPHTTAPRAKNVWKTPWLHLHYHIPYTHAFLWQITRFVFAALKYWQVVLFFCIFLCWN